MKKIAIFQFDLGLGGIQKSLINLLSKIDLDSYEIDLYLFDRTNFFETNLDSRINIIYLKKYPKICKLINFNILYKIIKINITKEYDLAIDFNSYSNECALNALKVKAKKHIIWCHNDIILKYKENFKYKILFNNFKGKYKMFDEIVAVSNGAKESAELKLKCNNVKVIPNIINTDEIFYKAKDDVDFIINKDRVNFISLGRLCEQKNFDVLITYFYNALKVNKNIDLYIIGDGEERHFLESLIENNNLQNNIILLGAQANPFKYMKQADYFILTSKYEGQGMVFLEAKALGLKIIMPEHLKKYVEGISSTSDITNFLENVKKENYVHKYDNLYEYNQDILNKFYEL